MGTISIHVIAPNGAEQFPMVEGESVRIGSAAHCEVRLPLGDAAPEHVLLERRGTVLHARALASEPRASIDGKPLTEAVLDATSVLQIGATEIRASILVADSAKARASKPSSPLAYLAMPFLIVYAILELFPSSGEEEVLPQQAPPLFAAEEQECPERQERAEALGREHFALAEAKRERSPFRASDGVYAVELYRAAAACFERAAKPEAARSSRAAGAHLAAGLEESYRTHRVRLEHAIDIGDDSNAQREVRALLKLVSPSGGEYVEWLQSLDRRLRLRMDQQREEG